MKVVNWARPGSPVTVLPTCQAQAHLVKMCEPNSKCGTTYVAPTRVVVHQYRSCIEGFSAHGSAESHIFSTPLHTTATDIYSPACSNPVVVHIGPVLQLPLKYKPLRAVSCRPALDKTSNSAPLPRCMHGRKFLSVNDGMKRDCVSIYTVMILSVHNAHESVCSTDTVPRAPPALSSCKNMPTSAVSVKRY